MAQGSREGVDSSKFSSLPGYSAKGSLSSKEMLLFVIEFSVMLSGSCCSEQELDEYYWKWVQLWLSDEMHVLVPQLSNFNRRIIETNNVGLPSLEKKQLVGTFGFESNMLSMGGPWATKGKARNIKFSKKHEIAWSQTSPTNIIVKSVDGSSDGWDGEFFLRILKIKYEACKKAIICYF